MKKNVLSLILLVFTIGLTAQNTHTDKQLKLINLDPSSFILRSNSIQTDKAEAIKKDIDDFKTRNFLDETILDSIVFYQFTSEFDSVRLLKKESDLYDSGLPKTRYEYSWDETNNQWVNSEKTDYTFNDNESLTSSYVFSWDADQNYWRDNRKLDITYDNNGYYEFYIYLKWNVDLNRWDNYWKEETDYDANGNLLLLVSWDNDDLNEWIYNYKEEHTFNTEGLKETSIIYFWEIQFNDWRPNDKEEYSHNGSGLLIEKLQYFWNGVNWVLQTNTEYTYTITDKIDYQVTFILFYDEWINNSKIDFDYDANDNEILYFRSDWDDNQWINEYKRESIFDNNNNMTSQTASLWNETNNEWVYSWKRESNYDENNHLIMNSNYNWSTDLQIWIGTSKYESIYNDEEKVDIRIYYVWNDNTNEWTLDEKEFLYRTITGIPEDFETDNLMIYPNPVESVLNIKRQSTDNINCSIISISGQKLMQFQLSGSNAQINVDNLPKGVYMLHINNGTTTTVRKIIKN